jgi:LmbE family N-acetylglucosaminyl deacetylase
MHNAISNDSLISLIRKPLSFENGFFKPIDAQTILILAPHPDDEVMGCGGIMSIYNKRNVQIHIIYLTDGRYGISQDETEIREKESCKLKDIFPLLNQYFLNFEDSRLSENIDNVSEQIKKIIDKINPEIIFTPWILDHHLDHIITSVALSNILKDFKKDTLVSFYEIMSPLFCNHCVDITAELAEKEKMLNLYESQVKKFKIDKISISNNLFRGSLLRRKSIKASECFLTLQKNDYIKLVSYFI